MIQLAHNNTLSSCSEKRLHRMVKLRVLLCPRYTNHWQLCFLLWYLRVLTFQCVSHCYRELRHGKVPSYHHSPVNTPSEVCRSWSEVGIMYSRYNCCSRKKYYLSSTVTRHLTLITDSHEIFRRINGNHSTGDDHQ